MYNKIMIKTTHRSRRHYWALVRLGTFLVLVFEQADYTVVKKMNGYEIRVYRAHIVAQTTVQGSYRESMSKGFRILAEYIFGGNSKKQRLPMTAPVVAQKAANHQNVSP